MDGVGLFRGAAEWVKLAVGVAILTGCLEVEVVLVVVVLLAV